MTIPIPVINVYTLAYKFIYDDRAFLSPSTTILLSTFDHNNPFIRTIISKIISDSAVLSQQSLERHIYISTASIQVTISFTGQVSSKTSLTLRVSDDAKVDILAIDRRTRMLLNINDFAGWDRTNHPYLDRPVQLLVDNDPPRRANMETTAKMTKATVSEDT